MSEERKFAIALIVDDGPTRGRIGDVVIQSNHGTGSPI